MRMHLDEEFSHRVYQAHLDIFEALGNRDSKGASEAMLRHIESVDHMLEAHSDELDTNPENREVTELLGKRRK